VSANSMLDIAIGLILMYLILSLICTTVNEAIAGLTKLRARALRTGISELIDNSAVLSTFNGHGLINGVHAALNGSGPSYLSGRTFAAALLDSLDPTKPLLAYQDVKSAIENLPTSNLKDTLLNATVDAGESVEKLRTNVASWFDSAMDRLSGLYKRWLQIMSFGVGLAIAVTINADSFVVAKALWSDPALRSQVVDLSGKVVSGAGSDADRLKLLSGDFDKLREDLRPLPIGWSDSPGRADHAWMANHGLANWDGWLTKIVGWMFTAVAVMLGAPFWFDLLSKFIQLRSSGDKPAKTSGFANAGGATQRAAEPTPNM
jgi:hypothetical protein